MILLIQSISRNRFEHKTEKNADGSRLRARRNGMTQTWKTRPNEFKIPIKIGLCGYGYITHETADQWEATE
jgi:hypothetical protein